ncbi:MAG: marine proteobacterial sortase target protein [Gammaproteobacteria bacterium]|nr:MAG: marine proteobacterial sortase target protein [Gammaproteobacteria bacterium]
MYSFNSILLTILFIAFSSLSSAEEVSYEPPTAGTFYISNNQMPAQEAINLRTDIKMQISGLSARVTVTQIFENTTDQWVEGKYLFPLPDKSAVDHLTMKIGVRLIIGEIKEKEEAKKIYQRAKLSGKKASLVEQHRPNLFTNSVANIGPYETIEIIIEYQQEVTYKREQGFSIRFPMTVTPRYQPVAIYQESFHLPLASISNKGMFNSSYFKSANDISHLFPTESDEQENSQVNSANIHIELDAGFALLDLSSKSHKLNTLQKTEKRYQINFANEVVKMDRDFILNWKPVPSVQPRVAMFSETKDQDNYVSMMILPPSTIEISGSSEQPINRETIFVIDTSGSMSGESMRQAKEALAFALTTLQSGDKFNVIEFNSTTSKLFNSAQDANESNISRAHYFVAALEADGGTEMFAAIEASLDGIDDHQLVRQVIFLTDGAISNEAELFSLIDQRLGDSRLYTVGIGSAPNSYFMKKAARFGRGTFTFIANTNESNEKMSQLFKQISQPQLTHININWPQNLQADVWPKRVPDLFDGEPLWIKAKVSELSGQINISGRVGDTLWQSSLSMDNSTQQSGVAILWAREKIESIMNSVHHGLVSDQQKQEIIDTAIKHHIVSRYTSLIAVDKTPARTAEQLHEKVVKNIAPKGSQKRRLNTTSLNYPNTSLDLDISFKWFGMFFILSLFGLLFLKFPR